MTAPASVILASAGSGKTFELAGRYVRALLESGGLPDKILATTFTRKAAGEMFAKVLERLIGASKGDNVAAGSLGCTPQEARELALGLARRIDRVRVQTLDSYFAEIGRFGASELGLTPGWRILDEVEVDETREQAIDLLCSRVEARALLRIIESMNNGGLPMRPRAELIRRAIELHDAFVDSGGTAEKWGVIRGDESAVLDSESISAQIAALGALPPVLTNEGSPHKGFARARDELASAARSRDWERFLDQTVTKAALEGKPYSRCQIPAAMREILLKLARHGTAAIASALAESSRAAGGLIQAFDSAYLETKRAENGVTFDDLPRLMLALSPEESEWVSYRMDGQVDHLLLDEFQDTSRVQYRVLEPLLRELTSGAGSVGARRSLFAVGDVKQSLYNWRGAVPELLEGLSSRLRLGSPETRAKSWRSSQAVLDAVNHVFGSIRSNPALGDYSRIAERWAANFHPHAAALDSDGLARIEQVRLAGDGEDAQGLVADRAIERVQEIHRAHPDWSIAILARTNSVIPGVIHRLKKADILAAQERGHPLMDEGCVSAVVSLLQLAEHPGDSASQFHVGKSALARIVGMNSPLDSSVATRVASDIRARIARDGIAGLIEWLRDDLGAELSARASSRLEHLERIALDFDAKPRGRIPEFIRLVHETAIVDASAGEVSVLTVHKAKGLEWDAVVLLDLERRWKGRVPAVVVDRGEEGESDPLAPVRAVSLWPNAAVQACHSDLTAVADRWHARNIREAISGLYVAMTRAKRRLEMIVMNEQQPRQQLSSARVLRAAVGGPAFGAQAAELFCWKHQAKNRERLSPREAPVGKTVSCKLSLSLERRETRPGAAPSLKSESRDAGAILREPTANLGARRRGDLWHAWMESVEWLEDWKASDRELAATAERLGCTDQECREQQELLRESLRGPIGAALSRKRYSNRSGTLRVLREWPLAWNDQGLVRGRVDRVVVGIEQDRPAWAEVIDFKTDNVGKEEIADAMGAYRAQIEAYRRAVCRAFRLKPAQVAGLLLFVKPGVIAEVFSGGQNSKG
ncbi:MAG: UvrD-helicase domain-containing protein [Phycisphaeraceae bacterium]|nr:UvrD-helicase domain-containing protein [Phycisphaeraceae bacterium]